MTTGRSAFEEQTEVQRSALPLTTSRVRPLLRWTDAAGAHEHSIDGQVAVVVGSAAGAGVRLHDPAASRLHCQFELRERALWVRDLGSRNGTFVEDIEVAAARVPDGARVRCGSTSIEVRHAPPAQVELWPHDHFGALLGRSVAMRELFAQLARVAQVDSSVLITGETGSGKELVATALHNASPRAGQPFEVIDCGAIPETLMESELFGHVRGAFTGADRDRAGAIELADGGTVFFDEIGELPLAMQPKLLRVIESRTVRRVGAPAHRPVNVRFVAATHRDLSAMVNQGAFREDLYFRLAVIPLELPPLRGRREDIPLLVQRFLAGPGGEARALPPTVLAEAAQRPWLGNVRELRNFVERAVALGPDRALAMLSVSAAAGAAAGGGAALPRVPLDEPLKDLRERWLSHLEREYIRGWLARTDHNVSAVAEAIGMHRTHLHKLIRRYEL